jgi:hypothetical protein
MIGTQIVEADSLQEAIELAEDFLPRPKRGEYLEGTLEVDPEFVSCLDNHNH